MATIAFLGTGTMGLPMCRNLARAGHDVAAWNRTTDRARELECDGVHVADSPEQAAAGRSVVVTMLADADAVLASVDAALRALGGDACWLQMSTIGVSGIERCVRLAQERSVGLIDAPVLGTREPARAGRLVILSAGPKRLRALADPLFDVLGSRTLWLGDEPGPGSAAKVAINSWVVGVVGALAETLSLAEGLGVDPKCFFEAIEGGPLDLPYARMKGTAMIDRDFDEPAFRLTLSRKDTDLVLAAGARAGLELPIMQGLAERLRRAEEEGYGDLDMAAMFLAETPSLAQAERLIAP
jgi:3-hydroxyisobutyrate dehydrogenase